MKLLKEKISPDELRKLAEATFGNLVKAVVDVQKRVIVVDAELHAGQEGLLLTGVTTKKSLGY